jgi:hypothetical protein
LRANCGENCRDVDSSRFAQRELDIGKNEGAQVKTGGERNYALGKGYFVKPTVFTDVDNAMRIAQEEIFDLSYAQYHLMTRTMSFGRLMRLSTAYPQEYGLATSPRLTAWPVHCAQEASG